MTLEQQSAEAKSARLLDLYARFISGQTLNKQGLAQRVRRHNTEYPTGYGVSAVLPDGKRVVAGDYL